MSQGLAEHNRGVTCPETVSHKKHLKMGKSKELPQDLHKLIVAKHTDGIGYRRISQLLNVPVSTIGAIIRKWKEHHFTLNRPRSGAPRKISNRGVKRITKEVVHEPRMTRGELQKDLELADHMTTSTIMGKDQSHMTTSTIIDQDLSHMTTFMIMDKDQSHMTERILDLTLEIIYLLAGEGYAVVKKTSAEYMMSSNHQGGTKRPITVHSSVFMTPENNTKILEVIQKMIELLTGEVPIRCQDGSMEEWKNLEGHKDLYKHVMMDHQTLTSPDGSSNGNPPERCPRPLYYQLSTHNDERTSHHDQNGNFSNFNIKLKDEIKKEEETEYGVMKEYLEGENDLCKDTIMGNPTPLTSPDGSSNWNPPERCPRPLYSTQEDQEIPQHHQHEEQMFMKVEFKEEEEETSVMDYQRSTEEVGMMETLKQEPSLDISTDEMYVRNTSGHFASSPDCTAEDNDITKFSPGVNPFPYNTHGEPQHLETSVNPSKSEEPSDQSHTVTPDLHLRSHSVEKLTGPSHLKETSTRNEAHTGKGSLSCLRCVKSVKTNFELCVHLKDHKDERPYSCSVCQKCIAQKWKLFLNQKIYTGESPCSCSESGKCPIEKPDLLQQQSIHTDGHP
ncbi:uncharacterized protein [Pyxicephalus adspersus]|uniref:uncharacterized protein isoform X2 n=1 Tax=Pyxicephalus adspersus TaxID=30357 RepID=UPI003B5C7A00